MMRQFPTLCLSVTVQESIRKFHLSPVDARPSLEKVVYGHFIPLSAMFQATACQARTLGSSDALSGLPNRASDSGSKFSCPNGRNGPNVLDSGLNPFVLAIPNPTRPRTDHAFRARGGSLAAPNFASTSTIGKPRACGS